MDGGLGPLRPPVSGSSPGKGQEGPPDPKVDAWILGMTKALQEIFAKVGNAPEGVQGKEQLNAFKENVDQLLTNLNPKAVRKNKENRLHALERQREAAFGRINSLRQAVKQKKKELGTLFQQIGKWEQEKGNLKMAIKEVREELQQEATDSEGDEEPHEYRGTGDAEEELDGEPAGHPLRRDYGMTLYQGRKKPRTGETQEGEEEQMDINI